MNKRRKNSAIYSPRLAEIKKRTDLSPEHMASVRRSYNSMICDYLQEIRLYEVKQAKSSSLTR